MICNLLCKNVNTSKNAIMNSNHNGYRNSSNVSNEPWLKPPVFVLTNLITWSAYKRFANKVDTNDKMLFFFRKSSWVIVYEWFNQYIWMQTSGSSINQNNIMRLNWFDTSTFYSPWVVRLQSSSSSVAGNRLDKSGIC